MDLRTEIPRRDIERLHTKALEFSSAARSLVLSIITAGFEVKRKPDNSFVTSADLRVEEHLRGLIQLHFPDHGVIGEEYPATNPQAAYQWIMDPIDGTEDFVQHLPTFGSILALHYRGEPLVGVIDHPLLDMRVHAAFGLGAYYNGRHLKLTDIDASAIDGSERLMLPARANFIKHRDDGHLFDALNRAHPNHRIFRSCFSHVCAVIGAADAAVDYGNPVWDFAASRILIEEAGGKFIVVRAWDAPGFGRVYGSVFGKPLLVDRLKTLFD
ncbi:MAG: hypothetical protein HY081_11275 [Gammaproteobacteria bacterium]|nr:hypothetical protein [Gammaproteobacteria bacterium]